MADVAKTVAIIFEGQDKTSDALAAVEQKLKGVDSAAAASTANLSAAGEKIDSLGTSSKLTDEQARALGDGLKKMASDAGAPQEALDGLDNILRRIGGPTSGSVVVAAAAIAAFSLIAIQAGGDVDVFRKRLENLGADARGSEDALRFVRQAVGELEVSLADGLDLYIAFNAKLDGTKISAKVAEDAFIGIAEAVKAQGGGFKETQKALESFIEAAGDGNIGLKELESKIGDIPGGLRLFADALGVPIDDLRKLAENGKLGREEIALFAETLNAQEYQSLSPVKDAFLDLWNTIKGAAIDLGSETGFEAVMWLIEKAIRAVTATLATGGAFVRAFGETLANVAFTVANLDFAGFNERQLEISEKLDTAAKSAEEKFLGLEQTIKRTAAPETAAKYRELANAIDDTGKQADPTAKKTSDLDKEQRAAERSALALAKASADAEKAIAAQAKETRIAEENAARFALEMEKIASNERIKFVEARVELDIAQAEANAKIIEAAFGSISETIGSTGDVLGDVLSLFKDIGSLDSSARNAVFNQLDLENARREEALKLQKQLTEAQIENIRAQTAQLEKGDAIIKVDGAGLQPHLEAFMWEILKTIQVRVNRDGLGLLLGV